jgi:type III secretory pathway lipoprotein EscJ
VKQIINSGHTFIHRDSVNALYYNTVSVVLDPAQDSDQGRALLNLRIPKNVGKFLSRWRLAATSQGGLSSTELVRLWYVGANATTYYLKYGGYIFLRIFRNHLLDEKLSKHRRPQYEFSQP